MGSKQSTPVYQLGSYLLHALVVLTIALLWSKGFLTRSASDNVLVGLGLGTVFLVIARQIITLQENERLNGELRAFSRRLEVLVAERTAKLTTLQNVTSALSAATSSQEACRIGLGAVLNSVGGNAAVFYTRQDGGAFLPVAVEPPTASPCSYADPDRVRRLVEAGEMELLPAEADCPPLVYVPVTERGQAYGLIEVHAVEPEAVVDRQTPLSLGAVFGVAYENQRRYEEARALAVRDPVTNLYNHRYLHTRLEELLGQARQTGEPLGLVLMDVNEFKLFNDTYGHPKGDAVLNLIAQRLQQAKGIAFAARFGGDEFAAVLPGADLAATLEFIRQFRESMEQQSYQEEGGEHIPIRLTFGYAIYPKDGTKRYEMVTAADARLYEAKTSGVSVVGMKEESERYKAFRQYGTFNLLDGLVLSIDNKDHYTKVHCDLVSEYAVLIAETMGLSEEVQRSLALAGALHDVGKICIPERILKKPGPLTAEEYEIVKLHVTLANNLIQHVPRRRDVLDAVVHHHERFDGTGYAKGLTGRQIPLLGRIMGVADAFSAMTLDRSYRKALPLSEAIEELHRGAGTQFDPEIVDAFLYGLRKQLGDAAFGTTERWSPEWHIVEPAKLGVAIKFRALS